MCISERLKQILEAKNMTVTEFSNVTGISYRSAMNYLNEGRDPNVDALLKIYKALGISVTWLLTGNGEMFHNIMNKNVISVLEEKDLLSKYRMLPPNLKVLLSNLILEIEKIIRNFLDLSFIGFSFKLPVYTEGDFYIIGVDYEDKIGVNHSNRSVYSLSESTLFINSSLTKKARRTARR